MGLAAYNKPLAMSAKSRLSIYTLQRRRSWRGLARVASQ